MAFLSGYTTRYKIDVANNVGSNLTNHQVPLAFNHSALVIMGSSQATGSDIVVTSSDGSTLLPYWIETRTINGSPCNVWTKLTSLGSAGSTTVYLYFDGATQTGSSNGANTFEWFDDFETYAVGDNMHTVHGFSVTTANFKVAGSPVYNGARSAACFGGANVDVYNGSSPLWTYSRGYTIEFSLKPTGGFTNDNFDFYINNNYSLVGVNATGSFYYYTGVSNNFAPCTLNDWNTVSIRLTDTGSKLDIYINGVKKATQVNPWTSSSTGSSRFVSVTSGGSQIIDTFRFRKYVGSDPNIALTLEEETNVYGPVVGSYIGDGTQNRIINFGSDTGALMVFVRGDHTVGSTGGIMAMANLVGSSWPIGEAGNTEPFFVTGMGTNSFIIGSNENINTNGSTYYYTVVPKNSQMITLGSYIGNNTANRVIPVGSDIACLILTRRNDGVSLMQFTGLGSQPMFLGANLPKYGSNILHISGGSFIVQNHALVNHSFGSYYWAAFHIGGFIRIGSYFGDDTNNREITTDSLIRMRSVFVKPHVIESQPDLLNGLLAYYNFQQGSPIDLIGSDNASTVAGPTITSGKIENGLMFTGVSQTIDFGSSLHTLAKTINIWVKRNNGGADATQIIWSAHTVSNGDPKIQHDSLGSSLVFRIATNGGEFEWSTGQSISPNTWTMITMVHDDDNNLLYGYKNGSVFGSTAAAVTHTTQEGTSSRIGGWYGHNNNDYCGSLDEVGFWSRALSATEIAKLFNNNNGLIYPLTIESTGSLNYASWKNLSMPTTKSATTQHLIGLVDNLITNMGSTSFTVGSDFNA